MMKPSKRCINWFVVAQGIAIFCIQLCFLPTTVEFVRKSEVVQARVTKLNAGGRHPQVEFTTDDGQRISVPASSFFSPVDVGDRMEMRYDPKHPHSAYANSLLGVWGIHVVPVFFSILFVLGGLLGLSARESAFERDNDSK